MYVGQRIKINSTYQIIRSALHFMEGNAYSPCHFSNKCSKKAPINYHIYNNDNNDATIRFA